MTELESELLFRLITAAWPLPTQIVVGFGLVGGYWIWSRLFYAMVDPWLRHWLGGVLGARMVWVPRHSSAYQTPLELGLGSQRFHRWTWGIEPESQRTLSRDGAAALLCFLLVTLVGGLWPVALFFWVALKLNALSYAVFLPACIAVVAIYSIYWSGRYRVGQSS